MTKRYGDTLWFIPDGFIPAESTGMLESHEAICLLNCNPEPADVSVTVYFEDIPPLEGILIQVSGNRTLHMRTDRISKEGMFIPKGTPYALKVESNLPIIVQFSRMDATQPANTLMTTMAYPGNPGITFN